MSKNELLILVTEVPEDGDVPAHWVAEVEVSEGMKVELNIQPIRIIGRSSISEEGAIDDLLSQLVAQSIITHF